MMTETETLVKLLVRIQAELNQTEPVYYKTMGRRTDDEDGGH